ncbi:MAG: DUF11 domain-containing protein [Ilumatobacteraceae bacterium]|nr:DUF11 domain-containing protein [Ilumatobacteraceae bacterium]
MVATFLLLMAGVIVSAPGLMSASATSSTPARDDDGKNNHGNNNDDGHDDGQDDGHHDHDQCENEDHGHNDDDGQDENENEDDGQDENENEDENSGAEDHSNDGGQQDSTDDGNKAQNSSATNTGSNGDGSDDGHHDGSDDGNDDGHHDGNDDGNDDGHHDGNDDGNDDEQCTPPAPPTTGTITVVKDVTNAWGGTLDPVDFQLKIDTTSVPQGAQQILPAGTHVISELSRPGYTQTDISCTDSLTHAAVADVAGSINLAAGQDVACTVFNADVPATLTVVKHVNPDVVPTAAPESFQLTIDDHDVPQNAPQNEKVGVHIVGEMAVAGYRLVAINCTFDGTNTVVDYSAGVTLALDQHVTCVVTNQHDPIDLAITKTVSATPKVAGGAAFDYTITFDNRGPRDATAADNVTVTDQLPAGFVFVSFPTNCSSALQTLTCTIAAADLEVADPPVVLTVTVKVSADTASGTYTNIAYVNTPGDPACVGDNCVPTCVSETNNVACATTGVVRQSSILVTKVDNVATPVHPGGSYAYDITVTNVGPSSFLPNMTMTDALPADLVLDSVDAASPWTCTTGSTIVCTYGATLAPGASAAVITVHVHILDTSVLNSVTNIAQAIAVVEPGNVVTGTDDEVTPILHTADLSIDKSASTVPGVIGSTFDWQLDVVNRGPDMATNLVINDAMPSQFRVESATSTTAGVNCATTASSVQCTVATLANGASIRITVHVTVLGPAGAAVTNTATVEASSADPNVPNNTDTLTVAVIAAASSPPVPAAAPVPAAPISEPRLPRTGTDTFGPLRLGSLLVAGGFVTLVIARRRRSATA